jgi:DNA polymerase III alpha subunit
MKIVSSRSLGKVDTYSIEMAGDQHNYQTAHSNAVHANSHGVSYCLMAYRCLWLKAHFAPEWWAAVMSDCHPDKLIRYMGIARSEGWKPTDITRLGTADCDGNVKSVVFDTLNLKNLTTNYTVTGNVVNQGLIGIKGIGENAANQYSGVLEFDSIDDFIEKKGGKSKTVLERFIKLGAFNQIPGHENAYALWIYYQYKYCSGTDITALRKEIREKLLAAEGWNDTTIKEEIDRQITEYRQVKKKVTKIPAKITNWKPKPNDSFEKIMELYKDQRFSLEEMLQFEKDYLGYYLHSPLDLYQTSGQCTIEIAKSFGNEGKEAKLEVIISDIEFRESKNGKQFAKLLVSDGVQDAHIFIWKNELDRQKAECLAPGAGVQMFVTYDKIRKMFALCRGEVILQLLPKTL